MTEKSKTLFERLAENKRYDEMRRTHAWGDLVPGPIIAFSIMKGKPVTWTCTCLRCGMTSDEFIDNPKNCAANEASVGNAQGGYPAL